MASCTTGQWASTAPQLKLTVSEKSSTDTSVTYSWTLQYIASSAANTSTARAFTAVIDGATVYNSTYSIDGKKGTYTVKSGTKTINKGTSARTVSFSCTAAWKLTWSGTYCASKSASGSFSIAKKTSYTVSYNANGGSGAPSSQTKWHGTNLTLSSTVPTKSGYTFLGWSTSSTATSATYSAGASYTANAAATLYAIWRKTISLTYSANGGTGGPGTVSANVYNSTTTYTFTISSTAPTKSGYTFMGWSTANDTSVEYSSGNTYALSANATLYAVWRKAITVSYNVNGGSGTVAAQTGYAYNAATSTSITISNTKPTRTYYNFLGWSTASNASTATYKSGTAYSFSSNVTLYAVWELAYVKPRITDVSIVRCDDTGKAADDGTYALVNFNWATDQTVTSVQVTWENSVYTHTAASGTMGIISNLKLGDGTLSIENKYTFTITVTDSLGSTSISVTLPAMTFLIDFLNGGKGISFGKPADKEGFECEFPAKFNNAVYGKVYGLGVLPEIPAKSDLNNYKEPGVYAVKSDTNAKTITNIPAQISGVLIVSSGLGGTIDVNKTDGWQYVRQQYIPYTISSNPSYERHILQSGTATWTYGAWMRNARIAYDSSGYPMIDADKDGWIRTPTSGLIPNVSGTSGSVGTSSWRFNIGYFASTNLVASGTSWIGGKTMGSAPIQINTQLSSGSYHPIMWMKTYSSHIVNLGGYINNFGVYGILSSQTANTTNWQTYWDCTNGNLVHNQGLYMANNKIIYGTNTSGTRLEAINLCSSSNNLSLGYGGYVNAAGASYLYGNNIYFTAASGGRIYIQSASTLNHQMNLGSTKASDGNNYYINNNATARFNSLKYASSGGYSSRRYKNNIEYRDTEYWHDAVMKMKPCTYYYNNDNETKRLGLIAEDLVDLIPELVGIDEDGLPSSVEYGSLTIPLIGEVQYLNNEVIANREVINALKSKVSEQDEIIKSQDERIAKLEALVQQLLKQ